jgi:arabinose-5-phosphate isomerase
MNSDTLIANGKNTLETEAGALMRLASSLDESFAKAVRLFVGCKGRVIVSGMGKSGHVARKIAATMASTGTPSYFVHPGEASHGDLGMITKDDVILALSYSGETKELSDLIEFAKRFSIPLVAMTRGKESALAAASDLLLLLPDEQEIALGHAPTTSTTMMLALGDALAVATLDSKGFTKEDFRNFHPGGKLGKTLMRVGDLMTKDDLPLVAEDEPMSKVLVVMTQKSFGCAGVEDKGGNLVGIITDGDLRRHMTSDLLQKTAKDVMTANPMTVGPRVLAAEALCILNEKKRTNLFVVEGAKPVGVLHLHDLLRAGIA